MSWRQADTQTIAINFLNQGSNIFYPQVNWGGNGPGYVESEFQIYTYTISMIMRITGVSVLPGQMLSLLSIIITALFLYFSLNLHFKDEWISLVGVVVFLSANGPVHLSTSVMPDGLSIMFYSMGFYFFLRYLKYDKNKDYLLFTISTILSSLIKPLALSLGIIQFLIIYFGKRKILKYWKIWISWVIILITAGTYMIFSYNLFLHYGNSFGVIGGDQKFPTLHGLTVLIHYPKLLYMIFVWGLGPAGFASIIYLLWKKKITYVEWALIIANLIIVFIAMRYMVNRGFSPHYYIYMAFLGAWLSAFAYKEIRARLSGIKLKRFYILLSFGLILLYSAHLYYRTHPLGFHYDQNVNAIGNELKKIAKPGSLLIVRSVANERERSTWGHGINNYEDPRIFYITGLKGWVIPADAKGFSKIKNYLALGADYYVDPYNINTDPALRTWLQKNSWVLYKGKAGIIYGLRL